MLNGRDGSKVIQECLIPLGHELYVGRNSRSRIAIHHKGKPRRNKGQPVRASRRVIEYTKRKGASKNG